MTLLEARQGLTLLVVGTVFASFLIPASVLLFYFSPVTMWRSPLFVLNVLSIIMGLTEQTLYIYVIINTTVFGGVPTSLIIMIVAMEFLVPICVEGILLVRLVSVYPPTSNTSRQNLAIYIPVVAFKIARLVNAGYATHDLIGHLPDSLGVIAAAQFVWSTKYVKVEWFLQLFDDMFVSGLFVHKLYVNVVGRKKADIHTAHSDSGSHYSWAQRIRTLYYIAVSNFVFPILFNIAEIVIIFYDSNFFHGATVVTVNCYVTIIGVLLATIWAQGSKREGSARFDTTTVFTSVEFTRPHALTVDEDDVTPPGAPPRAVPEMQGLGGPGVRSRSIRGGKHALVKSVGGTTSMDGTAKAGIGEKRVSKSSESSSGHTIEEPGPELHRDAASYAHVPSSLASVPVPESRGASVVHGFISDAV